MWPVIPAAIAGVILSGFVDSTEIVEGEPARDSGPVVLPFLAERVRKAREPSRAHADAEIWRSTIEVQIRSGSGLPLTGTTSTLATSAGL